MQRHSYARPLYGLAAWSDASYAELDLDARIAAVEARVNEVYDALAAAEARGFPPSLVAQAFAQYDAFGAELDAVYDRQAEGWDTGTAESLTAFDATIESLERRVADWDPLGTESAAKGRTSLLVYATLGSLLVAGAVAGAIYFFSRGRR